MASLPEATASTWLDHGAQRLLQDLARGGIVVHDQHAKLRQLLGNDFARAVGCSPTPSQTVKVERAADARFAFEPDAPAHQLDQPAADGEAQAGAAVLARRGHVGLRERLEQFRRLLRASCRCRCRARRT